MFADVLVILFHALLERSRTIIPRHDNPTYRSVSATSAKHQYDWCVHAFSYHIYPLGILTKDCWRFTWPDSKTIENSGALLEDVGAARLFFFIRQHVGDKPPSGMWGNNNDLVWGMHGAVSERRLTAPTVGTKCPRGGRGGDFNHTYTLPSRWNREINGSLVVIPYRVISVTFSPTW